MKTLVLRHEYRQKSSGHPNLSWWSICETDGRILLSTRSLRTFRAALNKLAGSVQHVPNDDQTGFQWSINWLIQQPQVPEPAPAPQQAQAQEQTPKHTPGRLSVHGCALYEQDNWQNGNNLARKLPVAITYHPEADREPSETEIANAQEIARRWNAFLDAKTPRAVCFHDDQPQPQAEPAPAPQQTQAKHTPGPWKVSEYEKQSETDCGEIELTVCTNYPEALCNGQRSIAVMTGGYYTRKDQKNRSEAIATNRANARLIAAAPQLLEALRNLVETPEVRIEDMEQARAAIAAATGE